MTLNRSEILFIYDAQDCNPNGNPIGDNRPRRDPDTGQGIVTDVRLKRYLRDQLLDDGFDIYVKKIDGDARPRRKLALDVLEGIDDAEDFEDVEDVGEQFLDVATDVRYFGATLAFSADDEDANKDEDGVENEKNLVSALKSTLPTQYQGPVQFLPSKSLNEVEENEEYDSLTSVISTGDAARQGGFDLDDKRIKYGIFPFWGLVDNNGARATKLTETDVVRLDTLCWRALKNQTTSRSKLGQEPRLYVRPEYEAENYHVGGLHNLVSLSEASEEPLRSVNDVVLDVTALVDGFRTASSRIETIHTVGSDYLTLEYDGSSLQASELGDLFESEGHMVHRIDVLGERDIVE